jgi:DNA-binding Lrp family transcriptional regulator
MNKKCRNWEPETRHNIWVTLRDNGKLTISEIAELVNISENATKYQINKKLIPHKIIIKENNKYHLKQFNGKINLHGKPLEMFILINLHPSIYRRTVGDLLGLRLNQSDKMYMSLKTDNLIKNIPNQYGNELYPAHVLDINYLEKLL